MIYIHWPFCLSKCPYCDFNSHVFNSIDHDIWLRAYLKELERYHQLIPKYLISSIFFGGGTPSLMKPDIVEAIIQKILSLWPSERNVEITLEANPTSIELGKFQDFKNAGINRVSIGIQALNDKDLKFLGRNHTVKDSLKALEVGTSVFGNCSFDLIYARPEQTTSSWEAELKQALSYGTKHLSLYQLTIEQGTKFDVLYKRGNFVLPDESLSTEMYLLTDSLTETHGLSQYEISNYAKKGFESRHNLSYWKYQDYIGIGPGAHGRITFDEKKYATEQWRAPDQWLKCVEEKDTGDKMFLLVEEEEQFWEKLIMGLRLISGVSIPKLSDFISCSTLLPLLQEKLIECEGDILKCTPEGRLKLNSVLHYLHHLS